VGNEREILLCLQLALPPEGMRMRASRSESSDIQLGGAVSRALGCIFILDKIYQLVVTHV